MKISCMCTFKELLNDWATQVWCDDSIISIITAKMFPSAFLGNKNLNRVFQGE